MKIGILINARLGSKRLPQKHIKIADSQPMLAHLIDRVIIKAKMADDNDDISVYIATGSVQENEDLATIAKQKNIEIFYGDPDNIPNRHLQLAKKFGLEGIISVDGDDILNSPDAIKSIVVSLRAGAPKAHTEGLPFGMNTFGYSTETLETALQNVVDKSVLETGWGRIFSNFPEKAISYSIENSDSIRASLDYPEDFEFFRRVFEKCPANILAGDKSLCAWIIANDVHLINNSRHAEYWSNFNMEKAKEEQASGEQYSKRLNAVIPGGAHTYSRGDDQYPSNAPKILERGKGAYTWTPTGQRFLDYGMALRAVNIGYAEPEINAAAIRQIEKGNNLTRASMIELEAAELLVSLIDSVDMVKFTKNGSTATSAAVKLARAYTGRDLIARCAQHPFFSYDDWFIGNTPITKGIPENIIKQTKSFNYNDINSLIRLTEESPEQFACVILEPAASDCPSRHDGDGTCCQKAICDRYPQGQDNFLKQVQAVCKKHGIVFILDEMITGFRYSLKGAQHLYGVTPDLSTFGKAMANGFSVAAVAGKREIMELGSIDKIGAERLFLLSTTHGAEMSGLGAFVETVRFIERNNVISHLWNFGAKLVALMNECTKITGIENNFKMVGSAVSPSYMLYDNDKNISLSLRTLFAQEMIKSNVLMPWIAICYRHGDEELKATREALLKSMAVIRLALDNGVEKYLVGDVMKPVFRKFN